MCKKLSKFRLYEHSILLHQAAVVYNNATTKGSLGIAWELSVTCSKYKKTINRCFSVLLDCFKPVLKPMPVRQPMRMIYGCEKLVLNPDKYTIIPGNTNLEQTTTNKQLPGTCPVQMKTFWCISTEKGCSMAICPYRLQANQKQVPDDGYASYLYTRCLTPKRIAGQTQVVHADKLKYGH